MPTPSQPLDLSRFDNLPPNIEANEAEAWGADLLAECRRMRAEIERLREALLSADPVAARCLALAGTEGFDADGHPIPTADPRVSAIEWIKQRRANGLDFRTARAEMYAARAALAVEPDCAEAILEAWRAR